MKVNSSRGRGKPRDKKEIPGTNNYAHAYWNYESLVGHVLTREKGKVLGSQADEKFVEEVKSLVTAWLMDAQPNG